VPQSKRQKSNRNRYHELNLYENKKRKEGYQTIAGVDEAGRGPLAGPVVAAACVIPEGCYLDGIDDSKKLTPKKRSELFLCITEDDAIQYGVAAVDVAVIDRVNILQATILAMLEAVEKLGKRPDYLLVDGMELKQSAIPVEGIIKGDSKSQSIAAASVLAKVWRDRKMMEYHERWPMYGFDRHKGYGTKRHLEALGEHGPCEIHRRSFEPVKSMISS